jgi:hypothetical protein
MPALQEFYDSTLYLIRAETAVSDILSKKIRCVSPEYREVAKKLSRLGCDEGDKNYDHVQQLNLFE